MTLRYEEKATLASGHNRGITCVAFSPHGQYLASGGLDNRICIWSIDTFTLLHVVCGTSPVLSLVWEPPKDDTVFCGLADGSVATIQISIVSTQRQHRAQNSIPHPAI